MNSPVEVLVAGGGIIGLTIALALAQRHYTVALLDAKSLSPSEKPDVRVYALNQSSEELFHRLGVWSILPSSRLSPYQHMHVWDASSKEAIDFDCRLIAAPKLGTIIEESVLKRALLQKLAEEPYFTAYAGREITSIDSRGPKVQISSGEQLWQADVLIIADGAESPVRNMLRVGMTSWSYHQHALVATVKTELNHQRTAYQVFNSDGPLAFLPLSDPKQCSIVWSTTATRAQALLKLPEEVFNQELTHAFAATLGAVEVVSPRFQFPLKMRHAQNYVGKNWLLAGDAAHTIHPLAGLGLNIGLADLQAFLNLLDEFKEWLPSTRLLNRYQRQRKAAVWKDIALMEFLKTSFANPLPLASHARSLGLRFCNNFSPLKRLFIHHARGI